MRNSVDWDELGIDAIPDRRRESRLTIGIPIEITGFSKDGKFFAEKSVTANVSESGCSFRLHRMLERGGVIAIKILSNSQFPVPPDDPLLYQVIYATKDEKNWYVGAAKLQEASIWSALALPAERGERQAS